MRLRCVEAATNAGFARPARKETGRPEGLPTLDAIRGTFKRKKTPDGRRRLRAFRFSSGLRFPGRRFCCDAFKLDQCVVGVN